MPSKKSPVRVLTSSEEADAFKVILSSDTPWKAACHVRLVRADYNAAGEQLEPGVNFFVMALAALGA
jgi:hypothetical protein